MFLHSNNGIASVRITDRAMTIHLREPITMCSADDYRPAPGGVEIKDVKPVRCHTEVADLENLL